MADKHHDLPVRQLDRRVVERYVKKGILDEKEYLHYLKTLPDLADKATRIETEFQTEGEIGPAR
ncbi:MAG: hypothetical protein ACJ783_13895 [Myxococcales bacterium]|nr:hypothetical protein [Myxococcales bacterium]